MEERNDIVSYQSEDGLVTMEALANPANETIRASQWAMAELFDVNTQAITRHLGHIYAEGELVKSATCSKMEQVRKEGGRIRATKFRIWDASQVALTLILPKAIPTKWTR